MRNVNRAVGFFKWAFVFVLVMVPSSLAAQDVDRTPGLRKIGPELYVYLHTDNQPGVSSTFNSGVIVTDDGVVVIDALRSEEIALKVRQSVSKVTSQPVRFLISSTPHKPFTGGNAVYADTFRISHRHTRTDYLKLLQKEQAREVKDKLSHLTFSDGITLHLGGREIRILFLGRGHTRGDTIVFLPEERVVYMCETYYYDEFPYISGGYSADWLRTLEAAEALEADIFIPGHGFLPSDLKETRAGLRRHWQILKDVRDAVEVQVKQGLSEDETVAAVDLPQYKKYKGYQRAMEIAVRRIYRELTKGLP